MLRLLLLVPLLATAACSSHPVRTEMPVAHIDAIFGDKATLTTLAGVSVNPLTLKGKCIALFFGASHAPTCHTVAQALSPLQDHADWRFQVVYIPVLASEKDSARFLRLNHLNALRLEPGSDIARRLAATYQADSLPKVVVISSSGALVTEDGVEALRGNLGYLPGGWE